MSKDDKNLNISGETVSFEKIGNYFSETWRSTDIEAMLDHREAQQSLNKLKHGDMQWVVYVAVLLIAGAIAVYILQGVFLQNPGNGGGQLIDVQGLADALRQNEPNVIANPDVPTEPPSIT